jgi:dihydrofolate reductase
MGRIIATFDMTLDGIFDHLEDWFQDDDASLNRISDEVLFAADAVLIGRETYEILSKYWMAQSDDRGLADRINAIPKFVASRTLTGELTWNATLIDGDIVEGVRRLRDEHRLIVSWGFGELGATLVEHELLDEMRVGVHPYLYGGDGLRLTSPKPLRLRTIDARVLDSGVTVVSYAPSIAGD